MSSQQYEPLNVHGMPMIYTCEGCGAVVARMDLHDDWHRWADEATRQLNRDYLSRVRSARAD